MSDKPAAYQLGMYISVFFIIVFGIFTYGSFSYNRDLIRKNAENSAITTSTRIIGSVNEKIVTIQEITNNLSHQIPHLYRFEQLSGLLGNIVDRYEYITSISIMVKKTVERNNGLFITDKNEGEPYFSRIYGRDCVCAGMNKVLAPMLEAGIPGWSDPYLCPRDSDLMVLYFLPFTHQLSDDPGMMEGYVACEISLDFMNKLILQTKIGQEGFAFLISAKGTFITHPMKELVLNRNLYALPPAVFKGEKEELDRFMNEDFGSITVYPDLLKHAPALAYHMKMPYTGWVLATTIPYRELNKDLYWLLIRMSIILVLVITAIFATIFYITSRIMKPLSRVAQEIHSFSTDYAEKEGQIRNEAEALSNSLKRLQKTYEKFRVNEAESQIKSERYAQELLIASEIQKSIIPPEGNWELNDKGVSVYSVFRPANMVSGDLYDFFMVDDKNMLITIGDVSGSGVPAALFMGVAHTFIKSFSVGNSPGIIAKKANRVLCRNNHNQFFITLFLAILNIEEGTMRFCNAGHTPAYVLRKSGKIEILDKPHGLPLGLYPERNYDESVIHMKPGDKLVLYTDGITDQTNQEGNRFGEEHLRNIIRIHKNDMPEELAQKLLRHVDHFRGNGPDIDDLSLMIVKYDFAGKADDVSLTG
ncbi:MAG: SpoIIE family protein phosphatase [Bacteroidota bacterium]